MTLARIATVPGSALAVEAIGHAREALRAAFNSPSRVIFEVPCGDGPVTACVTLRINGRVRGCWSAKAHGTNAAISAATFKALGDPRRNPLSRADIEKVSIEVWLRIDVEPIVCAQPDMVGGVYGLEVRGLDRSAYYLPAVAIERAIDDAADLQDRVFRKARLWSTGSRNSASLFRTSWRHLVEGPQGAPPLELRRLLKKTSAGEIPVPLRDTAAKLSQHLVGLQRADGSYIYAQNPIAGSIKDVGTSPVRLIGCTLALQRLRTALAHAALPASDLEHDAPTSGALDDAIGLGASWIQNRLVETSGRVRFQRANAPQQLGSAAFSAMTLSALPSSAGRKRMLALLDATLRGAIRNDGSFASDLNPLSASDVNHFGPGQAILALAILSDQEDETNSWVDAAFSFYAPGATPGANPFFVAWQLKAWSMVAIRTGRCEHADMAYRLADIVLGYQIKDGEADERGGFAVSVNGYSRRPPSFLAALFTEALLSAVRLSEHRGESVRGSLWRDSVVEGLDFLVRLIVEPYQSFLFRPSINPCGGIRRDLASFEMRCDYTMHAGTCVAAALAMGFA